MAIAATLLAALLAVGAQATPGPNYAQYVHGGHYMNYTSVPGYFLQDDPSTNASTFDYTAVNFGLINRTYDADDTCRPGEHLTQWQRFEREVLRLNQESPKNVEYKVIWFGRHAEGFHNAEQTFVGTPAWNCYWAELTGNSTASWADAHLTPAGIQSALVANAFWKHEIEAQKIPTPGSFYTSPLFRCLQTANLTFTGLPLPKNKPFIAMIKELLRENISIHTCDRRSNKTFIHESFPSFRIEEGFHEHDPLWNGVTAETESSEDVRSRVVLDDIFTHDCNTYISVTSHSGEIGSILEVLNHIPFSLNTGAIIPVLIRAEALSPKEIKTTTTQDWTASAHCTVPPVSSVDNNGPCACPSSAAPVTTPLIPTTPP
ncbi:phosphoglycerate mutase-like protein [Rhizodiscina lignyota]|uniref:Phosphoglycerate mutase-like protein n=1 Tax=Rhizodiscina lignyota TaxID=1504668 RepID=A0A9P4I333_9PEZI|nr:phosphoglycerate mutase-like protein [Rhizodiscina lignyota]